jgi:hypothetical protein
MLMLGADLFTAVTLESEVGSARYMPGDGQQPIQAKNQCLDAYLYALTNGNSTWIARQFPDCSVRNRTNLHRAVAVRTILKQLVNA